MFDIKVRKCIFKNKKVGDNAYSEIGYIHRLTPPLNIEVWDKDGELTDL